MSDEKEEESGVVSHVSVGGVSDVRWRVLVVLEEARLSHCGHRSLSRSKVGREVVRCSRSLGHQVLRRSNQTCSQYSPLDLFLYQGLHHCLELRYLAEGCHQSPACDCFELVDCDVRQKDCSRYSRRV